MENKIKNWLEEHEYIYGVGLLCISLCTVAFGGAYLGAHTGTTKDTYVVNLYGSDAVEKLMTK